MTNSDFGGVSLGSGAFALGFEPRENGDWADVDAAAAAGRVAVVRRGRGARGSQVVRIGVHGRDRRVGDQLTRIAT